MKRTTIIMVCLAITFASQLNATAKDINTDKDTLVSKMNNTDNTEPPAKKSLVYSIPNGKLDVQVNSTNNILEISLSGVADLNLDWIIFKPKGEVISRISSSYNIDKILLDGLEDGNYVLMVKDDYGRILHHPFKL